jgi:GMP synthase (glutamine-hydrolysing)
MLHILIAEGTPAAVQAERANYGIPASVALFETALQVHHRDVRCSSVNLADGRSLPDGVALDAFDGVMFTGSPLYVNDAIPAVTHQLDFVRALFATTVPVWGSCWGIQLAATALGGMVRHNPQGRELGVARAISLNAAGRAHPMLAGRPYVYDALCSHMDEIEQVPPGGEVLAANALCDVQALAVTLPLGGLFYGTQYHPEHTLIVSAALMEIRAEHLVKEGFGVDVAGIVAMANDYRALHAAPERRDLIWRYGISPDILDPVRRTREIGNWLRSVVLPRKS